MSVFNISVIIPFYNSESTIAKTLASVLTQTFLPREIIVIIDGCDAGRYFEELEKLTFNIPIYTITNTVNKGPSFCRNVGVRVAIFDYIAFLDADDVWHPQKLELQTSFMVKNNLSFSFHKYHETPIDFYKIESSSSIFMKKEKFIFKQYIATPTVIIERANFIFFDDKLRYCEDYLCWLMNLNDQGFFMIDEFLAHGFKRAIGESGLSSNIKKMHLGYLTANYELLKNGKISLFFFFLAFIVEYFKYPLRYWKKYL
ncbi:glycosyltransferase family 2 protein [Acinetobacter junii]|uniref:glycosyltransferase family 2 protein n=1 Tax=Acinetobacter junii TaxID=40215 RepID=UPI000579EE8F|nr:glycosyltransferase family 2 protein [Acinetobacter junii]